MTKKLGRPESMLTIRAQEVFESLCEQATVGQSTSWLELMIDHKLSVSSLARILRKLEYNGQIVRRCGRGGIRNEYIIKEEK
jgi:hypothetical protein